LLKEGSNTGEAYPRFSITVAVPLVEEFELGELRTTLTFHFTLGIRIPLQLR
jgi:hypothetical protein